MKGPFMSYLYLKCQNPISIGSKDIAEVKVFFLEVWCWRRHRGHDNSSLDIRPGELKKDDDKTDRVMWWICKTLSVYRSKWLMILYSDQFQKHIQARYSHYESERWMYKHGLSVIRDVESGASCREPSFLIILTGHIHHVFSILII
jgi:hypothetical protein